MSDEYKLCRGGDKSKETKRVIYEVEEDIREIDEVIDIIRNPFFPENSNFNKQRDKN